MELPVDFEKLVRLPDGNGYPYSIKATHLMQNFAWCDLLPSDSTDDLRVELEEVPGETARHTQRRMRIVGAGGIEFEMLIVENGELRLLDVLTKTGESKPIP